MNNQNDIMNLLREMFNILPSRGYFYQRNNSFYGYVCETYGHQRYGEKNYYIFTVNGWDSFNYLFAIENASFTECLKINKNQILHISNAADFICHFPSINDEDLSTSKFLTTFNQITFFNEFVVEELPILATQKMTIEDEYE
ncbi:Protein of unknown function [Cotesia congregata]|uniref:Uncharacterized protein n=1 Tax=Cotesia congregata TaxID=51543 RepID=A0A8J2E2W6_COTCN|nr:Protein of unknown function [Cotesia congregata]